MREYHAPGGEIYVNGLKAASVAEIRTAEKKELFCAVGCFEQTPQKAVCTGTLYELELTRVEPWLENIRDGIELRNLSDFTVLVRTGSRSVVFGGCNWREIAADIHPSGTIEKAKLSALTKDVFDS